MILNAFVMEIICYRCGRGEYPENTILGIKNCQNVNPNWRIEMDIQITKDGKFVLFHDSNTERITGESKLINELMWSDVKKLNAGYNFTDNGQYIYRKNPVPIPELETVFKQFPQTRFLLDVNTKDFLVVNRLISLIEKYAMSEKVIVTSRYDNIVSEFLKKRPTWKYAASAKEVKMMVYSSLLFLDNLFPIKSDVLMLPQKAGSLNILTKRVIAHAKKRNKKLWVWLYEGTVIKNVDTKADILRMKELGADGVFTDYPKKLMRELRQNQHYDRKLFVVSSN